MAREWGSNPLPDFTQEEALMRREDYECQGEEECDCMACNPPEPDDEEWDYDDSLRYEREA